MNIEPVTLRGSVVRLEPLALSHVPALCEVGLDPALWRWIPQLVSTPDDMRAYVEYALEEQQRGGFLPFAIVHEASGAVIGSTRYCAIERVHHRLEIGWTWYAKAHQRTAANTETKLLLLTHAFETLACNRVELKTDALNEASRRAIARIGGVQEGIFRKHMVVTRDGRIRDTVYFSIIKSEWPAAKANLLARLTNRPA